MLFPVDEDLEARLREAAGIALANRVQPPFRVEFTRSGVLTHRNVQRRFDARWWFWIDADGKVCPPPHTIEQ